MIPPRSCSYLAILLSVVIEIMWHGGLSLDIFKAVDPVEVKTMIALADILYAASTVAEAMALATRCFLDMKWELLDFTANLSILF